MKRQLVAPRGHWQQQAEEFGFEFHTMYGETYWDESRYYQFSLAQIENDIEDPTEEIGQMCLEAVDKVVNSEELLAKFQIPQAHWETIARAWRLNEPSLYARIDLAYDGNGPAKLLENNADTPTSLYESGFFQWLWLEDRIKDGTLPASADQFNSIQEALIERFREFRQSWPPVDLHFAACQESVEDRGTVQYLQDCAEEAGFNSIYTAIEEIGIDNNNQFVDSQDKLIRACFKLYPWEFMLREEFGDFVPKANVRWLEPEWKSVLSNKALLPLLWQMFPNHPNLLPAYFADNSNKAHSGNWVKKPIFSREGANISIIESGQETEHSGGTYGDEGFIIQQYQQLPKFGDDYALIGSWLIGDKPAGISIREDHSRITQDLSRFVPHCILD